MQDKVLDKKEVRRRLTSAPPPKFASLLDEHLLAMWRLVDKPKNIYIAASINANLQAAQLAIQLLNAGFKVTSSWILLDHVQLKEKSEGSLSDTIEINKTMGAKDLLDLSLADTLIVLTDVESTSGGLHVELGYFLGAKKLNIVVVGCRLNVFFWAPSIRFTPYVDGLVEWLQHPEHGT